MRMAISVARPNLVSLGTCLGKFSKSGKFKLHITALDYLAQYAKYKVGISPFPTAKLGRSEIPSDVGTHSRSVGTDPLYCPALDLDKTQR